MLKAIRAGTLTPAAPAAVYSAVTRRILGNQRTGDHNGGREMARGCQLRPSSAAAKLSCIGDTCRRPLSRARSRRSTTVAAQFGEGVGVRDCCEPGHRYSHNAFAKQNKTLLDWISKWVTDTATTRPTSRDVVNYVRLLAGKTKSERATATCLSTSAKAVIRNWSSEGIPIIQRITLFWR